MIVTIDGPAGTGKSTVAKRVAEELGFEYLDTGAMYRMVGLFMLESSVDVRFESLVSNAVMQLTLSFKDGRSLLNGEDVTHQLRTSDVTYAASKVAGYAAVRKVLVSQQQEIAANLDIVCEGRDQGTVVFPDAECKFFLTAQPEERAKRRMLELESQGESVDFVTLLQEQMERDERDQSRSVAPLKPAEDAIIIDTSTMKIDAVVKKLVITVRSKSK